MSSQTSLTTRRQFLERSMLGFGGAFLLPSLLASCTDHLIDPTKPPVGSPDPSKGVDYYAYLDNPNFSITIQKPTDLGNKIQTVPWPAPGFMFIQMMAANLQIAELDIGVSEKTGRFQWHLYYNGVEISSGHAEIDPLSGDLNPIDSTISDMMETPSITTRDYSISYGFYDAGSGHFVALTNQDQFYIYATANLSNWMGNLANANPSIKNAPFNRFVLPGAHDAGMFDTAGVQTLMSTGSFKTHLAEAAGIGIDIIESLSPDVLLRASINLAFTQKDTIIGMLNLGIRYFDFRPGYNFSDATQSGLLYHQHNFIPGYPFGSFIRDICQWLLNNPSEIVVVSLGHSGFNQDYMKASLQILWGIIEPQLRESNIGIGNKLDLATSYSDLIQANKRLIVLAQYGFESELPIIPKPNDPHIPILDTTKYDSYNDGYQTTNVNVILDALNGMNADGQTGNDYTVLQLQGTASGASGGAFDSIASLSDTSSPLMSTKAHFDHATYPWLQANGSRFVPDQLLVCLNDFADNALVEYCIDLIEQRASL